MSTPRVFSSLLLAAGIVCADAQENPAPAPADEPVQSEMQKWIATTDAQWQAALKRDVTDVHEAELNKIKLLYLTSLEDGIKRASSAGDLDGAVMLRNEQKRFGDSNLFPDQDDAADAASVKQIRAAIRAQLAKAEKDNVLRAKALHAKYDQMLAQAQTQLTQRERIDDALLVKAKRAEVAAAWITPAVAGAIEQAAVSVEKPAVIPTVKPTASPIAPIPGVDPKKSEEMGRMLIGTWRFTWPQNGWTGKRVFNADGTFRAIDPDKAEVTGRWEGSKDKITATYPNGGKEELMLPLHTSGTKVIGHRKRELKAVKEKP